MIALDPQTAARLANAALGHVGQEYPHKLDHVLLGDEDAQPPRVLHPLFFGSFDWHSCVHGWWTLLTLRRLFPDLPEAERIAALAETSFTAANVAAERAYLTRPQSGGFERPYGWAWLLALHGEAARHADRGWAATLEPLARDFAERMRRYLAVLTYPVRTGTHFNTAFALIKAHEWAREFDPELAAAITARAVDWFGGDQGCQAWEPSGDDFLSPALIEASAMAHCLPESAFADWFAAFLPDAADGAPATLFTPATVSDRSDGKIAHLDGLNLSRAWCLRFLAGRLPDPVADRFRASADAHLACAWPHVTGDYAGEHWLASFALLALLAAPGGIRVSA